MLIAKCSCCRNLVESRLLIDFEGNGQAVCPECDLKACTEALDSFGIDFDQLGGEVTL